MKKNIAFCCNNQLIEFLKNIKPEITKLHFSSNRCCGQFRSQNYGEAHHFKEPHENRGEAVNHKVFSDVEARKVVIQNAC